MGDMTLLAIVDGDTVITYPATPEQCGRHANRAIGAKALAERDLSRFGIVRVTPAAKPSSTEGEEATEGTPERVNGVWTQQWQVTALDAGAQTAKLARARREVRERADAALPDLSIPQVLAIAEVISAKADPSPTAAKYPVVNGYRLGAGITLAQAVTVTDGWRTRVAEVEQARAAALKALDDNGLAGIATARALMDAL